MQTFKKRIKTYGCKIYILINVIAYFGNEILWFGNLKFRAVIMSGELSELQFIVFGSPYYLRMILVLLTSRIWIGAKMFLF